MRLRISQVVALAMGAAATVASGQDRTAAPDPWKTSANSVIVASSPAEDGKVTLQAFRTAHPAPDGMDELKAAIAKAHRFLMRKGRRGYSSSVVLAFADHTTSWGRDYVFSSPRPMLREVRAGYDSIVAGNRFCTRHSRSDSPDWTCSTSRFYIGLGMVVPDAILRWESDEFPCETGWCRVYRFVQAMSDDKDGPLMVTANPDRNYTIYSVFVRKDGSPFMETEEGHGLEAPGGDWALASYVYDFNTRIRRFSVPHPSRERQPD